MIFFCFFVICIILLMFYKRLGSVVWVCHCFWENSLPLYVETVLLRPVHLLLLRSLSHVGDTVRYCSTDLGFFLLFCCYFVFPLSDSGWVNFF